MFKIFFADFVSRSKTTENTTFMLRNYSIKRVANKKIIRNNRPRTNYIIIEKIIENVTFVIQYLLVFFNEYVEKY